MNTMKEDNNVEVTSLTDEEKKYIDNDILSTKEMYDKFINEVAIMEVVSIEIRYTTNEIDRIKQFDLGNWIDLRLAQDVHLKANEFKLLSLGVAMKLPTGYEALVIPRSSTFKNYGILQANSIGLIDESYCGNGDIWKFPAYATREVYIPKNTRICQFRILKHQPYIMFTDVLELSDKDRGGFGSTGKK